MTPAQNPQPQASWPDSVTFWRDTRATPAVHAPRQPASAFDAQIVMFPRMVTPTVLELIDCYRDVALGWKLSGAGGGGYLVVVAEQPIEDGIRIAARRVLA